MEPSQLSLPLEEFHALARAPGIARPRRVFSNRDLRMSNIAWVGFDMDYTLAIYNQQQMDELSIRATIEKLVARGYPEFLRTMPYSIAFPVRGLLIDKRFGHILKMNRYKFVTKGYHGFRELGAEELRELYHSKKIRPATPRYHWIDTLYALSEAAIYAALVEAMEKRGLAVDYGRVFQDIRESIDEAHRDGTILETVAADFPRFVNKDPELAPTLHKLRSAGKKLFVLTNSRWSYTEKMMSYLLDGQMIEYPHWRNYFDVVVVAAMKPAFFQERRPLMQRNGDKLEPATFPLERATIYEGGNLHELERALGAAGDEILYVGDHIYGDILRSKKESAWRTAMIIQELEGEVLAHESCREDFARQAELGEARDRLEDELRFYQTRFKELSRRGDHVAKANGAPQHHGHASPHANGYALESDGERSRIKRGIDRVRARLRHVEGELRLIERRIDQRFHPFWGSLLKEENEESSFGAQVEEYACLYTARVSNFLLYSPQQYFRSPRDEMAHEIG
ncbi:MAG TPA: HAD-IG family 5'-nucleotidase [Polyangiaceae bacterium]|nr:HAD-IG family 5'-nucleotidase [Polyangiaceae bacterium]